MIFTVPTLKLNINDTIDTIYHSKHISHTHTHTHRGKVKGFIKDMLTRSMEVEDERQGDSKRVFLTIYGLMKLSTCTCTSRCTKYYILHLHLRVLVFHHRKDRCN